MGLLDVGPTAEIIPILSVRVGSRLRDDRFDTLPKTGGIPLLGISLHVFEQLLQRGSTIVKE